LTSDTAMRAPNTPRATRTPAAARASQKRSYSPSARSGSAAWVEARAVAFARVRDQRELADDERLAGHVEERVIEAAVVVLEYPQSRELAGEPLGFCVRVAGGDTQQHDDSRSDLPRDLALDRRGRVPDALDHRAHGYSRPSPSLEVRGRRERAILMCGVASLRFPWFTRARPSA
jgi:hypothetical protein